MNNYNLDHLDKSSKWLFLIAATIIVLIDVKNLYSLWQLDPSGLTLGIEHENKLPYWDFSNLWTGALFAREGNLSWLFDIQTYREELDAFFGVNLERQEWSYPPHILLVGTPLSYLPIFWAYILWTVGGLIAFAFALRVFELNRYIYFFVLMSPAIWLSVLLGQNGAIVAALFIGGLHYSDKRPILAGILFGLLTMKPHLGILIPFILMMSGNWRTFFSAAGTTILLILTTYLMFGFEVWQGFFEVTRPLMTSILEAEFPAAYHVNMVTAFALARSMGADILASYGLQFIFFIISIGFAMWIWRAGSEIGKNKRIILTGLCAIVATPYAYTYDGAIYYLAVAWYLTNTKKPNIVFIAVLWLLPMMWQKVIELQLPAAGVLLISTMIYLVYKTDDKAHNSITS